MPGGVLDRGAQERAAAGDRAGNREREHAVAGSEPDTRFTGQMPPGALQNEPR